MDQVVRLPIPVYRLECESPFNLLSDTEKKYAHFISKASWAAAPIVLHQTSEESPLIFNLLLSLFSVENLKEKSLNNGVTADSWKYFLNYVANFFGNMGNYLSFGDTKFLPAIEFDQFAKIISATKDSKVLELFQHVAPKIYSLENNEKALNIPPAGISTYYSSNIRMEDIELVQKFMTSKAISPYNTRLFKYSDNHYELRLASAIVSDSITHKYENATITITYGDYQKEMQQLVDNLVEAEKYVANDTQKKMMQSYIKHFQYGDINDHKEAQRFWVQDKGPVVETNIGFIESYRDPYGVRGEYESFVSVVDKAASQRLQALVDGAPKFLPLLPWGKEFEKDVFLRPDFTSLSVLTFASSGLPAGINIPNYDDIRADIGFKNVSLGNVLSASSPQANLPFLLDSDAELFRKLKAHSFEVQVALHELLGHGSGKLLTENDGKKNFDPELVNPITNEKVSTWYRNGETYDTLFLSLASAMEECRAECVGLYLSTVPEILKLFGVEAEANVCSDITYINWLGLMLAGLKALEFYTPETKKWRQAHMQARHAITRLLLDTPGVLTFDTSVENSIKIHFNREKLLSDAFPALGEFLKKIMVYKATADVKGATELFSRYTDVDDAMLKLRDVVLKNAEPRAVFVQANTYLDGEVVTIKNYDATPEGIVQSFLERGYKF